MPLFKMLTCTALFCLMGLPSAQAQFALRAGTVGTSGTAQVSGTDVTVRSTLGQPVVGRAAGAGARHGAGFWFGYLFPQPSGVDVEDPQAEAPATFALEPNYPNPFNPSTTIAYALPEPAEVTLRVYDAFGRTLAVLIDRQQAAGRYTVRFEAGALASGLYLYHIQAGAFEDTRTMLLVK